MSYSNKTSKAASVFPSILAYQKYGLSRQVIQQLLIEEKQFPTAQFGDALEKYYLLYWDPSYLLTKLQQHPHHLLVHQDDTYIPIWNASYLQVKNAKQVSLSFRKPITDLQLSSYVIISI